MFLFVLAEVWGTLFGCGKEPGELCVAPNCRARVNYVGFTLWFHLPRCHFGRATAIWVSSPPPNCSWRFPGNRPVQLRLLVPWSSSTGVLRVSLNRSECSMLFGGLDPVLSAWSIQGL